MVLEDLLGQPFGQDVQELVVHRASLGNVHAESLELEFLVARAHPEVQAAVGHRVRESDLGQETCRLVQRQDADRRPQPDPLRLARHVGHHHQRRR